MKNSKIDITNDRRIIKRSIIIIVIIIGLSIATVYLALNTLIRTYAMHVLDSFVSKVPLETGVHITYSTSPALLSLPTTVITLICLMTSDFRLLINFNLVRINRNQLIFISSARYGYIVLDYRATRGCLVLSSEDKYAKVNQSQFYETKIRYTHEDELYEVSLDIDFVINPKKIIQQEVAIFMLNQRSYRLTIDNYLKQILKVTPEGLVEFPKEELDCNPFGLDNLFPEVTEIVKLTKIF